MDKRFLAILGVIVAVFIGVLLIGGGDDASAPASKVKPSSHITGNPDAKITLVEYGDFQCSACYRYYPVIEQVKKQYGDKIAIQFRHFPLVQPHPNAFAGSRAAEAASRQGKFWEMYGLLYENQDPSGQSGWVASSTPQTYFDDYAKRLGLNVKKFQQDFKSESVNAVINADLSAGKKLGVNATPTFYLNGKKLEQLPADFAAFQKPIDAEIAKQAKQ